MSVCLPCSHVLSSLLAWLMLSLLSLFTLLSLLSYASNQTVESATIGSGFPSMRPFGVWSKVVFGLRKHNLASTPNNVFRGPPLSALKLLPSPIGQVLSFTIYATARFCAEGYKKDRHDGRPIIYNNVEKRRAGTEAEDVGVVFPHSILFDINYSVFSVSFESI